MKKRVPFIISFTLLFLFLISSLIFLFYNNLNRDFITGNAIDGSESGVVPAPWFIAGSKSGALNLYFGEYGDIPVPADYDGDGITDLAVFRTYANQFFNGPSAKWIIKQSSDDVLREENFGSTIGHIPVPADYDGDGKADLAVVGPGISTTNPSDSWTIKQSSDNQVIEKHFGGFIYNWQGVLSSSSHIPIPADYDKDKKADLAVFYPIEGKWIILQSKDNILVNYNFGGAQYIPVPADYDGDGKADIAVWNPSDAKWTISQSRDGSKESVFGGILDIPVPADYDGDGKADIAVFRKNPSFSFSGILGTITAHASYDYEISAFKDDDGTYRLYWCGYTPTPTPGYIADAVYYSYSSNPTSGFSTPRIVSNNGCAVGVVKVPGTSNSRCGGNPVYLMYYENSPDYSKNTESSKQYGNKIALRYSCDASTWTFLGNVLQLDSPGVMNPNDPWGGYPYGLGHPKPLFINGKVYLFFYSGDNAGGINDQSTHLAISDNGEQFTKIGKVGYFVSSYLKYFPELNIFPGIISGDRDYSFFSKDAVKLGYPFLTNQYTPVQGGLAVPKSKSCLSGGVSILSNPQGIIQGKSTYVYASEWEGICGTGPDRQIDRSEIYVVKMDFNYDSGCRGSKYRTCLIGSCKGIQSRSCSGTNWGSWNSCEKLDSTCSSTPTCTSFAYSSWGACQSSGTQTRTVTDSLPSGCSGGSPVLTQPCTYVPSCTDSDWTYSLSPSTCPSTSQQTKTWTKTGTCSGGITKPSSETMSCTYQAPTCVYTYSDWSECFQSNSQSREIASSSPSGCQGNPIISQSCIYIPSCTESNWNFILSPSTCPSTSQQTKTWTKTGTCSGGITKPSSETISCVYNSLSIECTNFTYSDWSECLQSGIKTRQISMSFPEGCSGGNFTISENCLYARPAPDFGSSSSSGSGSGGGSSGSSEILPVISNNPVTTTTSSEVAGDVETNEETINLSGESEDSGLAKKIFVRLICWISHLFNGEERIQCVETYL